MTTRKQVKPGLGRLVAQGDQVTLHYLAATSEHELDAGRACESSYDRGEPVVLDVGDGCLLPKLEEALVDMQVGSTWRIVLHATDAYGKVGLSARLPADSELALELYIQDAVPRESSSSFAQWFSRVAHNVQLADPNVLTVVDRVSARDTREIVAIARADLEIAGRIIDENLMARQGLASSGGSVQTQMKRWLSLKTGQMRLLGDLEHAMTSEDHSSLIRVQKKIQMLRSEVESGVLQ
jgi:hypothetical protein